MSISAKFVSHWIVEYLLHKIENTDQSSKITPLKPHCSKGNISLERGYETLL